MSFYAFAAALFIAWSAFLGITSYHKGRDSRTPEVAEYQAAIKASEVLAREATDRAEKATARVVTEYRDRVKVIREVTPGEIQLVEVVKQSTCELPNAWRVLHDSAASGGGAAESPGGTVSPADAIETVTDNYRIARENSARLEALQTLIRSQSGNDH